MTDEKDNDVDNVIYGPWGFEPVFNKYDKVLQRGLNRSMIEN